MAISVKVTPAGSTSSSRYVAYEDITVREFVEDIMKTPVSSVNITVNGAAVDLDDVLNDGDSLTLTPIKQKSGIPG